MSLYISVVKQVVFLKIRNTKAHRIVWGKKSNSDKVILKDNKIVIA